VTHAPPEPLLAFDGASPALIKSLSRVDGLQRDYAARRSTGRILANSLEAIRVELTYHSNAIEGSTLTLRETQLVIEGRSPTSGKSMRELYEARNHDRALRQVEAWVTDRPAASPITERDLLDVHASVLADIDAASAGRFRRERVLIKGTRFVPPGAQKFGVLVPALLELANRPGVHPVIRSAELHYNLVAVHPFNDGNGRAARLMMNFVFLRAGYPFAVIEVERRGEYLAALEEANAGRWEAFAAFVADSVERTIRKLLGDEGGSYP
jgi:Fic family protein